MSRNKKEFALQLVGAAVLGSLADLLVQFALWGGVALCFAGLIAWVVLVDDYMEGAS
jgi:hypothetical protein